jgi:metal transporter CNNM
LNALVRVGALEYSNKNVKDVMTPIDEVFMLEASTKLTFEAKLEIYKSGYTRIPVYDGTVSKYHVINILYVKDLILVDPGDEVEVQTVVSFRCSRL